MKRFIRWIQQTGAIALCLISLTSAAETLTSVQAMADGNIQLRWSSVSNGIYRVEYLDALASTNNDWKVLATDYPAVGTNTHFLDVGKYDDDQEVVFPKLSPHRFYRAVRTGTNQITPPTAVVLGVTNNQEITGEIVLGINWASTNVVTGWSLYVDGQEQYRDGTNWTINTCEWPNGSHEIHVSVKVASNLTGPPGVPAAKYAYGVSSVVPVYFNNYVSQISFSEPFFEPSLGQTQKVTAVLESYSRWIVEVLDINDTVVRAVTNSGYSVNWTWDGKNNSGSDLADGRYFYRIYAETNQAPSQSGSGGGGSGGPPVLSMMSSGTGLSLPPLPPGAEQFQIPIETSSIILENSFSQSQLAQLSSDSLSASPSLNSSVALMAASPQTSPKTPKRPPIKPVKGKLGTYGIGYFTFPGGVTNGTFIFPPVPVFKDTAEGFAKTMGRGGFKPGFIKSDNNLSVNELKRSELGGSNIFNSVNIGLLMSHGGYGTSIDTAPYCANTFQTYLSLGGTNSKSTLPLSQFHFGGNLRWMAILACYMMRDQNFSSMFNNQVLPIGDELHLLCGAESLIYADNTLMEDWARELVGSRNKVRESWFTSMRDNYSRVPSGQITNNVYLRVVGWESSWEDYVDSYVNPDPSVDLLQEEKRQVYP